jgi:L,D-transpeptidase ErfK/SrfK
MAVVYRLGLSTHGMGDVVIVAHIIQRIESILMSKILAKILYLTLIISLIQESHYAIADQYIMPPDDIDIVGAIKTERIKNTETVIALTRRLGFGQEEVLAANSSLDRWAPTLGEQVILPSRYILPDAPHTGIIVNLPEMRLYYYLNILSEKSTIVETFPVSIGRTHWSTPLGHAQVVKKKENPDWYPPASIKLEAEMRGQTLPDKVPAGPSNPLGQHAIYLNLPGYLLHGTNAPNGIGMQVTHGCIRLYPADIKKLYSTVEIGTPVELINQPVKVGWYADELYIEVHPAVVEPKLSNEELLELAVALIKKETKNIDYKWRTSQVRSIVIGQTGIPMPIHRVIEKTSRHVKKPER